MRHIHVGSKKILVLVFGGLLLFFLFLNIWLGYTHIGKTYARTSIHGQPVGSQLVSELVGNSFLPKEVTVQADESQEWVFPLEAFGITQDDGMLKRTIMSSRHWLPIINAGKSVDFDVPLRIDEDIFDAQLEKLVADFFVAPQDARISIEGEAFVVNDEVIGKQASKDVLRKGLLDAVAEGQDRLWVALEDIAADVVAEDLGAQRDVLEKQAATSVVFTLGASSITPSVAERLGWYMASDSLMVLSDDAVRSYITQEAYSRGEEVQNADEVVTQVRQSIESAETATITMVAVPKHIPTHSYCVSAKNIDTTHLADFRAKIAVVLSDGRGWASAGQRFVESSSNCGFTMWLSAADQLPSFSSGCSAQWSCRAGTNVIINYDRWTQATDAWNGAGGNLEDYRVMVINHEVGHWLGFGHANCSGAGQPAPVMQQQSIDLQGCAFNPWPLASEIASL